MTSRLNQDSAAGAMFLAFGAVGLVLGRDYPTGTALRMGAGYVPQLLCWLMLLIGLVVAVKGLFRGGAALAPWAWKPLAIIIVSILVFAGTIEGSGLAVACFGCVIIGAYAGHEFRLVEMLIVATVLTVGAVLLFVYGLGLPMAIKPLWLG